VGPCGPDVLCLVPKVVAKTGALPDYRIAVIWFQLDDDGPDPAPLVAYDGPVAKDAPMIKIAASAIAPPNEPNQLCARACDDEATCPCLSDPKIGYGLAIAYLDTSGDGKYTYGRGRAPEGGVDKMLGIGTVVVGHSAQTYVPSAFPAPGDGGRFPLGWDRLWPEGIDQGTHVYRVFRPDGGGSFDKPGKAAPGATFELRLCTPEDTTCDADEGGPNLT
jgi:hypothetical protein